MNTLSDIPAAVYVLEMLSSSEPICAYITAPHRGPLPDFPSTVIRRRLYRLAERLDPSTVCAVFVRGETHHVDVEGFERLAAQLGSRGSA